MANVVDLARNAFRAESMVGAKLNKQGCRLKMDKAPRSRVLVDIDKLDGLGSQRRPDFLFFSNQSGGWAIPIELKRGAADVADVEEQLQGGARIIEERIGADKVAHFRALLVSGALHRADSARLRRARVMFDGQKKPIRRLACGSSLELPVASPPNSAQNAIDHR